jgi:hypothetical protein
MTSMPKTSTMSMMPTTTRMGASRSRRLSALLCGATCALLAPACGLRSPEEQVLEEFFRNTRLMDATLLAKTATVAFDPRTQGSIQQFRIAEIGPQRSEAGATAEQVTIQAQVRTPEGPTVARTLVATLQRRDDDGRWLVTALR